MAVHWPQQDGYKKFGLHPGLFVQHPMTIQYYNFTGVNTGIGCFDIRHGSVGCFLKNVASRAKGQQK